MSGPSAAELISSWDIINKITMNRSAHDCQGQGCYQTGDGYTLHTKGDRRIRVGGITQA